MTNKGEKMNFKGYVLIEVLVASALLALAGAGLYSGFSQGIRAERMIRNADAVYDPVRMFWMRLEKDLRNSVALRGEKYTGKKDEMNFPVLVAEIEKDKKVFSLRRLRYFLKNGALVRSEQKISNRLVPDLPVERVVLKNIASFEFNYAYLDEEEKLDFEPFWKETPYFGIPKAVQIKTRLTSSPQEFLKLVSIPQGKWGHITQENNLHG